MIYDILLTVCSPQAFRQSSAPGTLSTLVTSVVLYLLTSATRMSPGKNETHVCGYVCSECTHPALWRTLMTTKRFFFVGSPQAFRQSSAPGPLSTLVTSVILYSFTRATNFKISKFPITNKNVPVPDNLPQK